MSRHPAATEADIQRAICDYLALLPRVLYWHVPNEGKRSRYEGARQRRQGMRAGVADITVVWACPDGEARVGQLEVKTRTGRQTKLQISFERLCALVGCPYRVVRSVSDVREALMDWGAVSRCPD